jgi:prepilin-type processing-associated H-X9-DG protein
MSSYMNPDSGADGCYYFRAWHKFHEINHPPPSEALVLVDEHQTSINDAYFMIGHTNHPGGHVAWAWYDAPALRHRKACTVSFVDGHVEVWRMVEPTTGQIATPGRFGSDRDLLRFYRAIPWRLPIGR